MNETTWEAIRNTSGAISSVLVLIALLPYLHKTITNKIKPHYGAWFGTAINASIIAAIALAGGAEAGSYSQYVNAIISLLIAIFALKQKAFSLDRQDYISLGVAIAAVVIWGILDNPYLALTLMIVSRVAGSYPTIRKAFWKPFEEDATVFNIIAFSQLFVLLANSEQNLLTVLSPISIVIINGVCVWVIYSRRKKLK